MDKSKRVILQSGTAITYTARQQKRGPQSLLSYDPWKVVGTDDDGNEIAVCIGGSYRTEAEALKVIAKQRSYGEPATHTIVGARYNSQLGLGLVYEGREGATQYVGVDGDFSTQIWDEA